MNRRGFFGGLFGTVAAAISGAPMARLATQGFAPGFAPPTIAMYDDGRCISGVKLLAAAHNRVRTSGFIALPAVYDGDRKVLYHP